MNEYLKNRSHARRTINDLFGVKLLGPREKVCVKPGLVCKLAITICPSCEEDRPLKNK